MTHHLEMSEPKLLSDPFLQLPTETSVRVVWFTEFAGTQHRVAYGTEFDRSCLATTTTLSRTREDEQSRIGTQPENDQIYVGVRPPRPRRRDIWRHEARVNGLTPGVRVPYQVTSVREDGKTVKSGVFSLAPKPTPGTTLKILLTSDHQLMPMVAANLQKVVETVGRVDAVFHAGDLVNIPDRASEWFDDNRGGAFFPCLQGRASYELKKNGIKTVYSGGELIQHAPLFAAIGNHEVMGRFSMDSSLYHQLSDAIPGWAAEQIYHTYGKLLNPKDSPDVKKAWLQDNSFNTDTYEELFSLPQSSQGGKKYYAVSFGDIRLVVLYVTTTWRSFGLDPSVKGRYREREQDLNNPLNWGYGQHIFEPISQGSEQYIWLKEELNRPEFQQAKYKIVMLHHPPHTLGDNIVPAYTDPVQAIERHADGSIKAG